MCCSKNNEVEITSVAISTHFVPLTLSSNIQITAVAKNKGEIVNANFSWGSSDNHIATVSGGHITPLNPGTALITASAGGLTTEPCTVEVADDWILYAGSDGLRIITPENTRDRRIPGTMGAGGPMLWDNSGIVYHTSAPFDYSYLWFRPWNSDSARMLVLDTLVTVHDIRKHPDGGYLVVSYPGIYRIPSSSAIADLTPDLLFWNIPNVSFQDFDVNRTGDRIVAMVRVGYAPRLIVFTLSGTPLDTLAMASALCPRFKPDGSRVAFGNMGRMWIVNIDGSNLREVIREGSEIEGISWSPDGASVAMCIRNIAGNFELWLGNPATGATTKLTNAQASTKYFFPQWID